MTKTVKIKLKWEIFMPSLTMSYPRPLSQLDYVGVLIWPLKFTNINNLSAQVLPSWSCCVWPKLESFPQNYREAKQCISWWTELSKLQLFFYRHSHFFISVEVKGRWTICREIGLPTISSCWLFYSETDFFESFCFFSVVFVIVIYFILTFFYVKITFYTIPLECMPLCCQ